MPKLNDIAGHGSAASVFIMSYLWWQEQEREEVSGIGGSVKWSSLGKPNCALMARVREINTYTPNTWTKTKLSLDVKYLTILYDKYFITESIISTKWIQISILWKVLGHGQHFIQGPVWTLLKSTSKLSTIDWFVRNRLFSCAGMILNKQQFRLTNQNASL